MVAVEVALPGQSYPVLVGDGSIEGLPSRIGSRTGSVAIVTDSNVGPLWADDLAGRLRANGLETFTIEVAAGESSKSWAGLARVVAELERGQVDRRGALVALGGGVVGDLAGLAAAVWMRGIDWFQVPTTLLAMVDSSVGGKTAIDTASTKNSIGAFWQPRAVMADISYLATLPDTQYRAAFAEVVKYGITLDQELFEILEANPERLLARDKAALELVVARSVRAKARVVVTDEREAGGREILNYGHTIGHALEVASGYSLAHGQAVASGMTAAAWLSAKLGRCSNRVGHVQNSLLGAFGLPATLPELALEDVMAAISRDKKAVGGEPRWVLLSAMGQATIGERVPPPLVREAVVRLLEGRL